MLAPRLLRLLLLAIALAAGAGPAHALKPKAVWEGVAYLPGGAEGLRRYDLGAHEWIEPIVDPLLAESGATGLAVDASGIYVAQEFIGRILRIPHEGGPATVLHDGGLTHFALHAGRVLALGNGTFRVLDAATGAEIDSVAVPPPAYTFAVAGAEGRVVFPAEYDLVGVDLDEDGTLGPVLTTSRFGPRNFIPELVALPDGRRVLEARSGHVFDARTLRYVEAIPADTDDIVFASGVMIARTSYRPHSQLMAFSADTLTEVGRKFVGGSRSETIVEHAGDVFLFWTDYEGIRIDVVPLADLALPTPPADYDPAPFDFDVRNLVVTREEVAIAQPDAVSGEHGEEVPGAVLLRWSVADRAYRSNIGLREAPSRLQYDADGDALYLFYPTGRIGRIAAPGGADPAETDFAVAPWIPGPVAKLGDRILIADGEGTDGIFALDEEGRARSFFARSDAVDRMAAVAANQRVYLFGRRDGDETLQRFGLNGGSMPSDVRAVAVPHHLLEVVPSPDGARLFDGTTVRDGTTLAPIASPLVPSRVLAAWLGSRLVWGQGTRVETASYPYAVVDGSFDIGQYTWVGSVTPLEKGVLLAYVTEGRSYRRNWTRFAQIFPGPDLDGDGAPNDGDLWPLDANESADRDGDEVGDNADAFPDNRNYAHDLDGDRIPDDADEHPDRAELAAASMWLAVGSSVLPIGRLRGGLVSAAAHVFADGELTLCPGTGEECIPGTFVRTRGGRIVITLPEEVVEAFEAGFEAELEQALANFRNRPVDLALRFRRDKLRFTGAVQKRGGRFAIHLRFPWEATTEDLKQRRLRGVFRLRGSATTMALDD